LINVLCLTMHHVSTIWHLGHVQRTNMGKARALFCRKLVEAQEERKKSDTKQNNGGGRLITQAKVWL
jgi:hypothetical protein